MLKRLLVATLLVLYNISVFLQFFYVAPFPIAHAATPTAHTKLIPIFVDQSLYDDIQSDITRYATQYIQKRIKNSKALVFPIDVDGFTPADISRIIENLYLEGEKYEASRAVGVVLIGDIPLPIVNVNGSLLPTIYPYVDFEEKKFLLDSSSGFFVSNDNPKGQAELWHGWIFL